MFEGEDHAKEIWRHEENMSYPSIVVVYFMQKEAQFMGAAYAISEYFANTIQITKKLSQEAELPKNYVRVALLMFLAWVHGTFPEEEARKLVANHTRWDPIVISVIGDRERTKRGKRSSRYTSIETVLVEHMEILQKLKHRHYGALLDTRAV